MKQTDIKLAGERTQRFPYGKVRNGNGGRVQGRHVRPVLEDEPRDAIVCCGSQRGLRLINAALRLWELRNCSGVLCVALLLAVGTVRACEVETGQGQAEVSAERIAAGKVADDESPCGPYVSDADCERAGEENDTSKGSQFVWEAVAEEEDFVSDWLGGDVDGASAGDE